MRTSVAAARGIFLEQGSNCSPQTKTCTQMFIAARGMIVSYQKIVSMETTKFPGTDEQIDKRRCILQKNITQPLKRKRVYLFLCPWDFPGKNTGAGSHSLLQGIFLTQGLIPDLLHCRQILYLWATREAMFYFSFIIYLFFWPHSTLDILVPWPGIEPTPPALEAWSLNHWATSEVPPSLCFKRQLTRVWPVSA